LQGCYQKRHSEKVIKAILSLIATSLRFSR